MKSQISIYVIIGLLIVIVTSMVYYRINQEKIKIITGYEQKNNKQVLDYVGRCVEDTSISALELLGEQGTLNSSVYIATKDSKVSYFYFKGQNLLPKISQIESQFSEYLTDKVIVCINAHSDYKINMVPSFDVSFDFGYLHISSDFEVVAKDDAIDVKISKDISTSFKDIYSLTEEIIYETIKDPEWINLEIIENQNIQVQLTKVNKDILIYELIDPYGLENQVYSYRFGVKYAL